MADTRAPLLASVTQVPTALVLVVTDAELPFQPHILSSCFVEWADVAFQFSIIGESHFVRIERMGRLWLHELLACTPLYTFSEGHVHPFDKLGAHDYAKDNYCTKVSFSQFPPRRRLKTRSSITVHFPRQHGVIPMTHVAWQTHPDRVDWWTLHTYPEAAYTTYVVTESSLTKPESASG
ncbi:MAG: DUF2617 family protein [Chloroflexota bacterium]|nr:DUF2617 family protein [Chloroflexota bacterium]